MEVCEVISCLVMLYFVVKVSLFGWYMMRCYLLPKFGYVLDLRKCGEWAIVTGGTDGIGKAYAQELAKRGLNIFLISRKKDKLDSVAKQITEDLNVKCKIMVYDFCNSNEYDKIEKVLGDLDIGVLVNNVGISGQYREFFDKLDVEDVVNVANVNMLGEIRLTHMVLKGMVKRRKGVVIHISSYFGYLPQPLMNIYPATKAFVCSFAKQLDLENESIEDLHHQLITPCFVATNMTNMKPSLLCPSSSTFAQSAVNTIGLTNQACGYWTHELQAAFLAHTKIVELLLPKFRHIRLTKRIT